MTYEIWIKNWITNWLINWIIHWIKHWITQRSNFSEIGSENWIDFVGLVAGSNFPQISSQCCSPEQLASRLARPLGQTDSPPASHGGSQLAGQQRVKHLYNDIDPFIRQMVAAARTGNNAPKMTDDNKIRK